MHVPMAICSSSPRVIIEATIRALAIQDKIDIIVSADELEHGKPHPMPYTVCAEMLGVDPSQILVFEDSVVGCKSARAAGAYVVAVPENSHHRFETSLCDKVIDSLDQFDVDKWVAQKTQA